ncbi:MAG: GNAT family N-acetyltransferase [Jatrophihabitans sp.]
MIALRPMTESDLPQIADWLIEPHVARWWLADQSAEEEMAPYPARLGGDEPTRMLLILEDDQPVGWCQWYRWADYPTQAAGIGAAPGQVGVDYALGDPAAIGRGLGTEVIAALVHAVRDSEPDAGIVVDPAADNSASRRVLEKNGFVLLSERPVATEPSDAPMAIYRLAPPAACGSGWRMHPTRRY